MQILEILEPQGGSAAGIHPGDLGTEDESAALRPVVSIGEKYDGLLGQRLNPYRAPRQVPC